MRTSRPLAVIDDFDGAADRAASILAAAEADGWAVVRDWRAAPGRRVVYTGHIAGPDDARRALLVALGGAALVVTARAESSVIDRFIDELRRLGPVDHVTADHGIPAGGLDAEQRGLLALLADGLTLGQAADELGLSRRTADRRLAAARRALGVATTAQAIIVARRTSR
jgi:DNA-binding NarL/FixJ family response regulator